jgi:hypothetical protein
MCTIITIASVCGKDKSLMSSSLKVIGTCNHLVLVIGPLTAT